MNAKRRKERRKIKRAARAEILPPLVRYIDTNTRWDRDFNVIEHVTATGVFPAKWINQAWNGWHLIAAAHPIDALKLSGFEMSLAAEMNARAHCDELVSRS